MSALELKDLPGLVGQELGASDWLQITQERVNLFAEATDDRQWIHVDVERATRELGGTIVHGYLTLSLLPHLGERFLTIGGVKHAINYGTERVRFLNMVRVGQRVRLRQKLLGLEEKAGGLLMRNEATIEIEGQEKPALKGEILYLLYPG
jgi:acyl dehydratase